MSAKMKTDKSTLARKSAAEFFAEHQQIAGFDNPGANFLIYLPSVGFFLISSFLFQRNPYSQLYESLSRTLLMQRNPLISCLTYPLLSLSFWKMSTMLSTGSIKVMRLWSLRKYKYIE